MTFTITITITITNYKLSCQLSGISELDFPLRRGIKGDDLYNYNYELRIKLSAIRYQVSANWISPLEGG